MDYATGTHGGWRKSASNPVLGGDLGVCFDIALLHEDGRYRMWFSWRTKKSIALTESADGIHWGEPIICLPENAASGWEDHVNRPAVLVHNGKYHLWYTGQANGRSSLGYAVSDNGVHWKRCSDKPVMVPEAAWEDIAIMCPNVIWDEGTKRYVMWYSAGENNEPNAIGVATSADGVRWEKHRGNPVFAANPALVWERHKCTACHVFPHDGMYYMFYIGFHDEQRAQIGVARSKDGLTRWERSGLNPILAPDDGAWDGDACYKPYVIVEKGKCLLWYNGRKGDIEQIGLATYIGDGIPF